MIAPAIVAQRSSLRMTKWLSLKSARRFWKLNWQPFGIGSKAKRKPPRRLKRKRLNKKAIAGPACRQGWRFLLITIWDGHAALITSNLARLAAGLIPVV